MHSSDALVIFYTLKISALKSLIYIAKIHINQLVHLGNRIFLTNMSRYGVWPSGAINSGPGFITKSNISLVEQYAGVYR